MKTLSQNSLDLELLIANQVQEINSLVCESYFVSKQTRVIQHEETQPTTRRLKWVHIDFWGPLSLAFLKENSYAADLIDNFLRKCWLIFIYTKNQFYDKFKSWHKEVVLDCEN